VTAAVGEDVPDGLRGVRHDVVMTGEGAGRHSDITVSRRAAGRHDEVMDDDQNDGDDDTAPSTREVHR
jgi:DNA replication and repair protein RecF